jgi:hypothetical protein
MSDGVFNFQDCTDANDPAPIDPIDMSDQNVPDDILPALDCNSIDQALAMPGVLLPGVVPSISSIDVTDPFTFFNSLTFIGISFNPTTLTVSADVDYIFTSLVNLSGLTWNSDTNTLNVTGGSAGRYILIRGKCIGAVATSDAEFDIDNVEVLAGELDPSGGDPDTPVTVRNIWSDRYTDREFATASFVAGDVSETEEDEWDALKKGSSGDGTEPMMVLIDDDIPATVQYDPARTADDPRTQEEIDDGYEVVYQNPIPDDDTDYETNQVDELDLLGYKAPEVNLKYFIEDSLVNSGTALGGGPSTIKLNTEASSIDDFYIGDSIELTSGTGGGQTATITEYDGDLQTATVETPWSTQPISGDTHYEVTAALDKVLATVVIDDPEHVPPRKIVRYDTTAVVCNDNKGFTVHLYDKTDYPDYDPSGQWPPPWVDNPNIFFKKRYRGIAISGVLILEYCKQLPPPPLPPAP